MTRRTTRIRHDLATTTSVHRDVRAHVTNSQTVDDSSYTSEMGKITVPFSELVMYHREIGIHRGRKAGFRDVFGFRTLRDMPFVKLAGKVKEAYEGKSIPEHDGWSVHREALRWLVDKGRDGIYGLDTKAIKVTPCPYQHYYIYDGHHRALALFILGESEIRAKLKRDLISYGRRRR